MWAILTMPREAHAGRWCVWAMYGGPVLLAVVSVPAMFLIAYCLESLGYIWFARQVCIPLISILNVPLAGLLAAFGAVNRRGSIAIRVACGLLYFVVGAALYIIVYLLLILVVSFFQH